MNKELKEAIDNALQNYKSNQKAGSPADSLAYDLGRIAGLKQAFEIVERTFQETFEDLKS